MVASSLPKFPMGLVPSSPPSCRVWVLCGWEVSHLARDIAVGLVSDGSDGWWMARATLHCRAFWRWGGWRVQH